MANPRLMRGPGSHRPAAGLTEPSPLSDRRNAAGAKSRPSGIHPLRKKSKAEEVIV